MNVPEPLREIGPDVVQIRDGGARSQVLAGLLAFGSGLVVLLIVVGVIPRGNAPALSACTLPFVLLIALMFLVAGAWAIAGRRWTTLYAGADRVVTQSGLFVPMRSHELPLHQYDAVTLRYAPGDAEHPVHYPLVLRAASGGVDLPLTSPTEHTQALEQAQYLAQFLRLSLLDVSQDRLAASGQEAVREPPAGLAAEAADEARIREVVEPEELRSRVTEVDGGVRMTFPRPAFPLNALYVPLIFLLVVAVAVPLGLRSFREQGTALWLQLVCGGVFLVLFAGLPLYAMLSAWRLSKRGGMVVLATREGITIEQREAWSTKTTVIPLAEIIDVDYVTGSERVDSSTREAYEERFGQLGPGPLPAGARAPAWVSQLARSARAGLIAVKTRQGTFTFGTGLPDDKVAYLWALLERALGRA